MYDKNQVKGQQCSQGKETGEEQWADVMKPKRKKATNAERIIMCV